MSVAAMSWAFELRGISRSDKLVLLALADHANDAGECYPGIGRLAAMTGLSARTVIRRLGNLERCGLLTSEHRYRGDGTSGGRSSNRYQLTLSKAAPDSGISDAVSHNRLSDIDDRLSDIGDRLSDTVSPESSEEPLGEPSDLSASRDAVRSELNASSSATRLNGKCYVTRRKRKLRGFQLDAFERFWEAFGLRKDKASAADAWLDLNVTEDLLPEILAGAERERRARAHPDAPKPKYPQGWLSSRRWEDDHYVPHQQHRKERPIWS